MKGTFTDSGDLKPPQGASSNPMQGRLPKMTSLMTRCCMVPLSPGRDYACRANRRCHTSTLIPKEAMEKKNGHEFESQEPTSPKVSCIGQVKKKKQAFQEKKRRKRSQDRLRQPSQKKHLLSSRGPKFSKVKSFFSSKKFDQKPLCESAEGDGHVNKFPSLGQMKKFSSGRQSDALANVWTHSQKFSEKCIDV